MRLQFLKLAGILSEKRVRKIDIVHFEVSADDENNTVTVVMHSRNRGRTARSKEGSKCWRPRSPWEKTKDDLGLLDSYFLVVLAFGV